MYNKIYFKRSPQYQRSHRGYEINLVSFSTRGPKQDLDEAISGLLIRGLVSCQILVLDMLSSRQVEAS